MRTRLGMLAVVLLAATLAIWFVASRDDAPQSSGLAGIDLRGERAVGSNAQLSAEAGAAKRPMLAPAAHAHGESPGGSAPEGSPSGTPTLDRDTRGIAGVLRVGLARPAGWPAERGWLYVLPAGARGASELSHVTHAEWELTCRTLDIPVAGPGPWDVFHLGGHGRLQALDVRLAGERTEVTLKPPALGTVRIELERAPPQAVELRFRLRPGEEDVEYLAAPGRHDPEAMVVDFPRAPGATTISPPLPLGRRWRVIVRSRLPEGTPPDQHPWRRWRAEPERVATGGSVRIREVPFGIVRLRPRFLGEIPEAWRRGNITVGIWLPVLRGGENIGGGYTTFSAGTGTATPPEILVVVDAAEGPATLAVRCQAAVPQDPIALHVVPGRETVRDFDITLDPSNAPTKNGRVVGPVVEAAPQQLVPVRLRGLPEGATGVFRIHGADPKVRDSLLEGSWSGQDEIQLDEEWTGLPWLQASFGAQWAARPVAPTGREEIVFEFEPAGHLLVAPSRLADPRLGRLRLRRADGLPLQFGRQEEDTLELSSFAPTALVAPGTVIGPLPPGVIRFEAWLGSQRLPDATARVVAGRLVPLVLDP